MLGSGGAPKKALKTLKAKDKEPQALAPTMASLLDQMLATLEPMRLGLLSFGVLFYDRITCYKREIEYVMLHYGIV